MRVGSQVAVSGTAPIWPNDVVDPDPVAQARRCWEIALAALTECGGQPEHVMRTRTYVTDRSYESAAAQVHGEHFGEVRPASTMVVVSGLLDPRWVIEVELDAVVSE